MLIASRRHTTKDLDRWRLVEQSARAWASTSTHRNRVTRSVPIVRRFSGGYAGVSWGKDSLVLADLVASMGLPIPLVWIKVSPIYNPDCDLVRDAFLSRRPHVAYEEIMVEARRDAAGWHATGTLERGFSVAATKYGLRYMSGVRAAESGARKRRMMSHGAEGEMTVAPLGWWETRDVWAYLVARDLPIHPAYACTMDGMLDPDRLRVSSLGGRRGDGHGRAEWERRYYGDELRRLETP